MLSIVEKETGIQLQAGLPDSNEQLLLTTMRMNHMCKQQTSKNRCYESISIKLKKKKDRTEYLQGAREQSAYRSGQRLLGAVTMGKWEGILRYWLDSPQTWSGSRQRSFHDDSFSYTVSFFPLSVCIILHRK